MSSEKPTPKSLLFVGIGLLGFTLPIISKVLSEESGVFVWIIDLIANWQTLFVLLFLIGVVLSALKNRRYLFLIPIVITPWLSASDGVAPIDIEGRALKVATANLHYRNTNFRPVLNWIAKEDADIIAVIEISPKASQKLQQLKAYPYQSLHPEMSPFGIGILSKYPFKEVEMNRNTENIPTLHVTVGWDKNDIRFTAFHPMPPISPRYHLARNQQFKETIYRLDKTGPSIVVGDFNATPWSSAFQGINYKRVTGLQPTWPSKFIGIPIDHILINEHWFLLDNPQAEDIGSDHMALTASLILAKGN